MKVRAIRGATTVTDNNAQEILNETKKLMQNIIDENQLVLDDAVSIFFTLTKDLTAAFPAVAVREMGINNIPLMCAEEISVPGSLEKCIRVMLHINTNKNLDEIQHVYLNNASILRPDLSK